MDGHSGQYEQGNGDDRMHDEHEPMPGVVLEPSVWRSIRAPFSYFSRMNRPGFRRGSVI